MKTTFHGWYVVGGAFVIALCGWGFGFYGPGVYLSALHAQHGWPTALIASAVTLYYLCGATWIIFVGDAIDRFGPRRVVLAGACALALGVALLPEARAPWHVHGAFMVMSLGWATMSGAAINAIVAPWFEAKRGLAISLALNGASCGGVFVTPLLVGLIARLGFRAGLWVAVTIMLLVLVPALVVLRRGPADPGRRPSEAWSRRRLLRTPTFLTISIPFALGLLAQVGFFTHQISYLLQFVGTQSAALAVSLTTVAAVLGRTVTGLVVDRLDPRVVSAANFALQAAALGLAVLAQTVPAVYLACILFGLGAGNVITLPSLIVQREFPREQFSRIVSLVVSINQFTFAFGPAILGVLRDWSGSYRSAFLFCIVLQATAAALVLLGRGQVLHSDNV
ncbi:MAG TPA: MFS transporter, partial [Candidatus Eisenbacteria bacterium]|nr:MFS transporter [Candidatus Eisenbacteria bacterium]